MIRFIPFIIAVFILNGCKKNVEKVIGSWELSQYVEYDSLGDRKFSYSYSQECPFKLFEIKANTWSKYDSDCGGLKQNESDGIYSVEEDTVIVEGFDNNGLWAGEWYVIRKLSKNKFEFDHIKSRDGSGDWEWVDNRFYGYRR